MEGQLLLIKFDDGERIARLIFDSGDTVTVNVMKPKGTFYKYSKQSTEIERNDIVHWYESVREEEIGLTRDGDNFTMYSSDEDYEPSDSGDSESVSLDDEKSDGEL
jgi:hypothetical protein